MVAAFTVLLDVTLLETTPLDAVAVLVLALPALARVLLASVVSGAGPGCPSSLEHAKSRQRPAETEGIAVNRGSETNANVDMGRRFSRGTRFDSFRNLEVRA